MFLGRGTLGGTEEQVNTMRLGDEEIMDAGITLTLTLLREALT